MPHFGHCPACGSHLQDSNYCGSTIVCSCGWTKSFASEKSLHQSAKRSVTFMVLFGAVFVLSFIQAVNWDTHSVSIIPLKMKQWSKTAEPADLLRVVEICSMRNKHDCVEEAYRDLYALRPQDTETLVDLGHLLFLRAKMAEAAKVFAEYFQKGGKNSDAAYDYARALTHIGKGDEAIKLFQAVLGEKKDVFQVTVARTYIQALIKYQKWSQAKATIEHYRKLSSSSHMFMERELKEIESQLKRSELVSSRNSAADDSKRGANL